jgi:hypothetical protein
MVILIKIHVQMLLLTTFAASGLLFAELAPSATPVVDYCEKQLAAELLARLNHSYPGYRAPRSTDNLAEDISTNLANGGTGCLGVALL